MKMKKLGIFIVMSFLALQVSAQSKLSPKQIMKKNYLEVFAQTKKGEKMPDQFAAYPGGEKGLIKDILNHLVYPKNAIKQGIHGKVFVKFVVEKDGTVDDIKVIRSVDPLLDAAAIRLVKSLKPWVPGYKDGEPIPISYVLPINYNQHSR